MVPPWLHCNLTRRKRSKIALQINPVELQFILLLPTFAGSQRSSVSSFSYFWSPTKLSYKGVSNGPIQIESASKIRPLLELLAKIR